MTSLVYTEMLVAIKANGKHWVQKPKYRNGSIQVRSKAAYWCLVPYWLTTVCVEALSQRVTLSLRCESQILGSRTVASIATTMHMTSSECGQTQTKTNGEWTNQWCRLYALDADASVVIISHRESSPNGSTNYTAAPKTKTRLHTPCHAKRLC